LADCNLQFVSGASRVNGGALVAAPFVEYVGVPDACRIVEPRRPPTARPTATANSVATSDAPRLLGGVDMLLS
jgi:hypothetical protein